MTRAFQTILLCLISGLAVWLWQELPDQGWAVRQGDEFALVAAGWQVLWAAWPLALVGLLISLLLGSLTLPWLAKSAVDADANRQIADLQKRLARESERADTAEQRIRASLDADWQRLAEGRAELRNQRQEAQRAVELATRQATEADQAMNSARFRARNAIHAAERIKKKCTRSAP
jgi:uncharacterized membrane-anchored protein YhcB (DUF1043 family)